MASFDVIVAGLGIMGAGIARELAMRGRNVLGIDPLRPPHDRGSSHGRTRIIREAYFESPAYVPLVQRAFDAWAALESEQGIHLYTRTGALMLGPASGSIVAETMTSVRAHSLPHERLDADQVRARFPALQPSAEMVGILEKRAGTLEAEPAHAALIESARTHGATLRMGVAVTRFAAGDSRVVVETNDGTYDCERLVVACGAWGPDLVRRCDLSIPSFVVERQVVAFFDPPAGRPRLDSAACPVTLVEDPDGEMFYTIPDHGGGLKAAIHHAGSPTHPDSIDRTVSGEDIARIRRLLVRYLPSADGRVNDAMVCMYTNSRDGHFVIDAIPAAPAVILASPCSGHGFKFAPVIGEIVAGLVAGSRSTLDPGIFGFGRAGS